MTLANSAIILEKALELKSTEIKIEKKDEFELIFE